MEMGVGALLLESSNILKYWVFSTINLPRHHLSCNLLLLPEIWLDWHWAAAEDAEGKSLNMILILI